MPPPDDTRTHFDVPPDEGLTADLSAARSLTGPQSERLSDRPLPEVPGYELACELGHGGMGVVYRARQYGLNREVAIKMVLAGTHARAEDLIRFLAEAETAAKLQHHGIAQIFDQGRAGGLPYFVMEYVPGGSLADKLVAGPLPPADAARLGRLLAEAVGHAHAAGVIHRDLKPANILLAADGSPKVTDFGLARRLEGGAGLTQTGAVSGTPSYMPPEQARGDLKAVGPAGDVYALGAILYECLTGRPPFKGANPADTLRLVLAGPPARPRSVNPAVPRDLETVVLKCLEKEPGRRYTSAEALATDLDRYLDGRPVSARRVGAVGQTWRWAKRNPSVAGLLAAVGLSLACGATVSTVLAVRADTSARQAREALGTADAARQQETEARAATLAALADADAARDAAQRQVVRLDITTATQLGDRGDHDQAFHWVARSWRDDMVRLKPGERLTAVEEADHRLRVGSAADRLPRLVGFCPHDQPVLDADCDPTGGRVVTLVGDEFARVWLSERAELAFPPLAHDGRVTSAVFSPDAANIATSSIDGFARVWDAASGALRKTLKADGPVARVAYHPDGTKLAVAAGSTVSVWDLATGRTVGNQLRAGGLVEYVAYSPDGSRLVTVAQPDAMRLPLLGALPVPRVAIVWDAVTGHLLGAAPHARFGKVDLNTLPPGWESSFERMRWPQFSPDSQLLTTSDAGGVYLLDDGGFRRVIRVPQLELGAEQITAAFTPEGKSLVFAKRNTATQFYDLTSHKIQPPFIRLDRRCAGVCLSPDGQLLAVTITGGPTTLYQLSTRLALPGVPMRAQAQLTALRFTGDGTRLLTASADGAVRVWQRPDSIRGDQYRRDCGRSDQERTPTQVFSPDGRWVATLDPKTLGLAVGPTEGPAVPLPHPVFFTDKNPADSGGLSSIPRFAALFSPTGRHLVTAGPGGANGGTVRLWEVGPDGVREVATASTVRVVEFSFSADGRRVAAGVRGAGWKELPGQGDVDRFAVWDIPNLAPVFDVGVAISERFTGDTRLNNDGSTLSVRNGGTDRLYSWEVTSGRRRAGGRFPGGDVLDLAVGPVDGRVAVVSSSRTLTQLDPVKGTPVGARLTGLFNYAAYSLDQQWLAVTVSGRGAPQRVQLYNADSGELLATVPGSGVSKMWFSADRRRLILSDLRGKSTSIPLGSYGGPVESLPTLTRLLTGLEENTSGVGFLPVPQEAIRTNSETYRRAFRAWKGLP